MFSGKKLIEKVKDFAISNYKDKEQKGFESFLSEILPKIHLLQAFYDSIGQEKLRSILKSLYKEYLSYTASNSSSPSVLVNSISSTVKEVSIICQNHSFLIDTFLMYLKSHDIYHSFVLHPYIDYKGQEITTLYCILDSCDLDDGVIKTDLLDLVSNTLKINNDWHEMTKYVSEFGEKLPPKAKEFSNWVLNDNFIILGLESKSDAKDVKMGLCTESRFIQIGDKIISKYSSEISIIRSDFTSYVHKDRYIDVITLSSGGNYCALYGMFTTSSMRCSLYEIPYCDEKIANVMKKTNFIEGNYNFKEAVAFLENLPRDVFLTSSEDTLLKIIDEFISSAKKNEHGVILMHNWDCSSFQAILYLRKNSFTSENKEAAISYLHNFATQIDENFIHGADSNFVTVQLICQKLKTPIEEIKLDTLKNEILYIIRPWNKRFIKDGIAQKKNLKELTSFIAGVTPRYKKYSDSSIALSDLEHLSNLSEENPIIITMIPARANPSLAKVSSYWIRIYYFKDHIPLYNILPKLNNFGVHIIGDDVFKIHSNTVHNLYMELGSSQKSAHTIDQIAENFSSVLQNVLNGKIADSVINSLAVTSLQNSRDLMMLRGYEKYLQQINFSFGASIIEGVLVQYSNITTLISQYFYAKFSPDIKSRDKKIEEISLQLNSLIDNLSDVNADRVLSMFKSLVDATLRTNFFVSDDGHTKSYISYKIDSSKVTGIPLPIPFREIFVYARDFEGIHIRFGKVARGGIRWSDRVEDFRTEVLDLANAQHKKNAMVVPVGAKGGFVLKRPNPNLSRTEYFEYGRGKYIDFISGCLDITDNIVGGAVVTPANVVAHDEQDPYFVAAADKGTATFSDYANAVAAKYSFWLGDAFASGGSNGYDHKKMGITAKGAWACVKRHFFEMDVNIDKDSFTCVGIGDMSGDVFGNGMLLSRQTKLIAAFNHMHIFIDPNPDTFTSFVERKRLFNLPRSSWTDYDASLISKGGGIFERSAKSITLTPEIKELFGINGDSLAPSDFIKAILKSKFDLLWNGGIGTYVKSSSQSNADVSDKTNDTLRINSDELNCKVVGEGGNLGLTQLARIEAATRGVKINADFIDNASGVHCSDREVNIKILLNAAISSKLINNERRIELLKEMEQETENAIINSNDMQALSITVATNSSFSNTNWYQILISKFVNSGLIDRKQENLPTLDEIRDRSSKGLGIVRPEIATISSYVKIFFYNECLKSDLDSNAINKYAFQYFPKALSEFGDHITGHSLKKEIASTKLVNKFINRLGPIFWLKAIDKTRCEPIDIITSYIFAEYVLDVDNLYIQTDALQCSWKTKQEIYAKITALIENVIYFALQSIKVNSGNLNELSKLYQQFIPSFSVTNIDEFTEDAIFKITLATSVLGNLDTKSKAVDSKNIDFLCDIYAKSGFEEVTKSILEIASKYTPSSDSEYLSYSQVIADIRVLVANYIISSVGSLQKDNTHHATQIETVTANLASVAKDIAEKASSYNKFVSFADLFLLYKNIKSSLSI